MQEGAYFFKNGLDAVIGIDAGAVTFQKPLIKDEDRRFDSGETLTVKEEDIESKKVVEIIGAADNLAASN